MSFQRLLERQIIFCNEASSNSTQAVKFIDGIFERKVTQDREFHFEVCQSC